MMEAIKTREMDDSLYPIYNNHSILEIVGCVLQCLVTISDKKFYNDTILIRTLYGSSDQRILKDKLDLSPEYGQLSYLECQSICKVVDWLIDNHYILKTKGVIRYCILQMKAFTIKSI